VIDVLGKALEANSGVVWMEVAAKAVSEEITSDVISVEFVLRNVVSKEIEVDIDSLEYSSVVNDTDVVSNGRYSVVVSSSLLSVVVVKRAVEDSSIGMVVVSNVVSILTVVESISESVEIDSVDDDVDKEEDDSSKKVVVEMCSVVSAVGIGSLVCIVVMNDDEVRRVVDLVVLFAEK
jgi:hypothetical protein